MVSIDLPLPAELKLPIIFIWSMFGRLKGRRLFVSPPILISPYFMSFCLSPRCGLARTYQHAEISEPLVCDEERVQFLRMVRDGYLTMEEAVQKVNYHFLFALIKRACVYSMVCSSFFPILSTTKLPLNHKGIYSNR